MEDVLDTIIQLKPPYTNKSTDRARFLITFDKSVHCYGDDIKSFGVTLATDSRGKEELTKPARDKKRMILVRRIKRLIIKLNKLQPN